MQRSGKSVACGGFRSMRFQVVTPIRPPATIRQSPLPIARLRLCRPFWVAPPSRSKCSCTSMASGSATGRSRERSRRASSSGQARVRDRCATWRSTAWKVNWRKADGLFHSIMSGHVLESVTAWVIQSLHADLAAMKSMQQRGRLPYHEMGMRLRGYHTHLCDTKYKALKETIDQWFVGHRKALGGK